MKREMSCAALLAALACPWAAASTQIVDLTALNSTTTLAVPFAGNENLLVNTLATGAPGALSSTVVFTVGAGVTSFSGARLLAAQRSLDRPVCLAVTPAAIVALRYLGLPGEMLARGLARYGAQCAQVPRKIATRGFIRRAHELGLQVHVWTLNTRAEIEEALDLGADGVMTDEVVLLKEILMERGQWHPRVPATPGTPVGRMPSAAT